RVGMALERHYGAELDRHLSELAFHFFQAAPIADPKRALHFSERAGRWASDQMGHEEAAEQYRRALDALELIEPIDDERRCDLLTALAFACFRGGHRDQAREAVDRAAAIARTLGDPVRLASAALALEPGLLAIEVGIVDLSLIDLLREAIHSLGDRSPALKVRLLARQAAATYWTDSGAGTEDLVQECRQISRASTDAATRMHALSAELWSLWAPEDLARRLEVGASLVKLADAADREMAPVFRLFFIVSLIESGDVAAADRQISIFSRAAQELRQAQSLWYAQLLPGMRALMKGDFDEAEKRAQEALRIGRQVEDANAEQSFAANIALLQLERGELEGLDRGVDAMVARYPGTRMWNSARLFIYTEVGRTDDARRELRILAANRFEDLPRDATWLMCMVLNALVCSTLGELTPAAVVYSKLSRFSRHHVVSGFGTLCWGSVARPLGSLASTLGQWDDAEAHFELAIANNGKIGALPWVAHSQYDYTRMLMRRGRPQDRRHAASLAEDAMKTARRLGMKRLEGKLIRVM
ncbi:MAG: hypothetical protein O7G30_05115, partial [Proteobacteria bacterium]|nr:hypothetical protein [Pseudomonadota bacterium]